MIATSMDDRQQTWSEFAVKVACFAGGLQKLGVTADTSVAIQRTAIATLNLCLRLGRRRISTR